SGVRRHREAEQLGSRLDRDDDFFGRNVLPGGCLYGLAPPSPNENCESLLPPTHGSQSGRGWKFANGGVIWGFRRIEDNPRFGHPSARLRPAVFIPLICST